MDTNTSPRLAARNKFHQHRKRSEHADKDRSGHRSRSKRRHHEKNVAALDLGNLSRASDQRAGNDMVQNWLAQSTIASQNYPTVFEDHRVGPTHTHRHYDLHEQRQSRPLPRDTRLPTLPRPRNPPLAAGTRHRSPPLQAYERPSNSRKRVLSDSSILSEGSNPRPISKHQDDDSRDASALHGLGSAELSRKLEVGFESSGSNASVSSIPAYRPKKSRHKTRDDRYEHKKDRHRSRKSIEDEPPPKSSKRRKEAKKKAMMTSKNVMNNWASKAVLNDRITQPIKPGIFKNRREAMAKPVQDLAFSDMRFLQDQRSSTRPKSLSERRLRELEKQQKEMKEASSFFLPARAADEILNTAASDQRGREQEILPKLQERTTAETRHYSASKSSQSQPSYSQHSLLAEQVSPQYQDTEFWAHGAEGARGYQDHHHRPISSKGSRPTTYLSWSTSSPRSPFRTNGSVSQVTSGSQDRRTTTPETIRRALVDSGIFRGTGIAAYDQDCVGSDSKAVSDEDQGSTERHGDEDTRLGADMGRQGILQRFEALLPPAWRVEHSQTDQDLPSKPQLSENDSGSAHELAGKRQQLHLESGDLRGNIADSANTNAPTAPNNQEKSDKRRSAQHRTHLGKDVNSRAARMLGSDNEDEISITSRDLMPPPPLPKNISQSRISDAVQRPSLTRQGARYLPTNKELFAAARVAAQHDTIYRNADSKFPSETGRGLLTEAFSHFGIAPLQSASWVTPSPKPPTPSLTTDTDKLGINLTSPCDVGHTGGKGLFPAVKTAWFQENMAEFIARIEREAEILPSTPMNNHHRAGDVVSPITDLRIMDEGMENDAAGFGDVCDGDAGSSSSSILRENQPFHMPSDKAPYWKDSGQFTSGGLEETLSLTDYEYPLRESIYPGNMEDEPPLPVGFDQGVLGNNESYEVPSFWGPNNFIQF